MSLYAWGANSYGQLGLGSTCEQVEIPSRVNEYNGARPQIIVGGGGHSMILDDQGTLWSTGWNSRGQLGLGHRNNVHSFQKVPLPFTEKVVGVNCGWDFSMIVAESGSVWGSGSNAFGQLGLGEECKGIDGFVPIQGVGNAKSVACGLRHSLILTNDGKLYGCGSSKRGQVGASDKVTLYDCTELPDFGEAVIQIAAGQHFSLALTESGNLFGFGENKHGELLTNPKTLQDCDFAHKLELGCLSGNIVKITCGWSHAALLLSDGKIITWGRNDYFQLGASQEGNPIQTLDLNASGVASGSEHCLAITNESKSLLAWGWNEHGSCGNGAVENVPSPARVKLETAQILLVGAASGHSFAVVSH